MDRVETGFLRLRIRAHHAQGARHGRSRNRCRIGARTRPRRRQALKFWVGVTDRDWYDFLAAQRAEEVNFWQPSEKPLARFLAPGSPFLFKLHSPDNFIVGGGFFVR